MTFSSLKVIVGAAVGSLSAFCTVSYLDGARSVSADSRLEVSFGSSLTPDAQRHWDSNWDLPVFRLRRPTSRCKSVVRNIVLVRHGKYDQDQKRAEDKRLLPIGWDQARSVGAFLKRHITKPDTIVSSGMVRAIETCNAVVEKYGLPSSDSEDHLLNEGAPIRPIPFSSSLRDYPVQPDSRIEAAFRKYHHRPVADQPADTWEIYVCHANVIRYFVCRALQVPPEAWLRFSYEFCGVTWLQIDTEGLVSVKMIGSMGFLPVGQRLWSKNWA